MLVHVRQSWAISILFKWFFMRLWRIVWLTYFFDCPFPYYLNFVGYDTSVVNWLVVLDFFSRWFGLGLFGVCCDSVVFLRRMCLMFWGLIFLWFINALGLDFLDMKRFMDYRDNWDRRFRLDFRDLFIVYNLSNISIQLYLNINHWFLLALALVDRI